ncbi:unnamed protein product, partial [Oppiella nova]
SGSGSDDTNCAQIQSIDECLNDSQRTDDKEAAVDQTSQDVHMKSAESLECLSTKSGAEVAAATQVSDTTSACTSASAPTVTADDNEDESSQPSTSEEIVKLKIVFNKTTHDIEIGLKRTGRELKEKLQTLIKVDPSMQKLVVKAAKLSLWNKTAAEDAKEERTQITTREPLCKQKQHKKVIDKGLPDDAMPAWRNGKSDLPPEPLHGMINKYNHKVRLTFKLELDQLWIGTRERTEKVPMNNIRSIVSEPIDEHPEYHVMGIQMGPTEASRIWLYWVPSQYVDAIKDTILGK